MVVVDSDLGVDEGTMVIIVCQSGIHIGERQDWVGRDDLVRTHPATLVIEHNLLDRDAMPGNSPFPRASPGRADVSRVVRQLDRLGLQGLSRSLVHEIHLTTNPSPCRCHYSPAVSRQAVSPLA